MLSIQLQAYHYAADQLTVRRATSRAVYDAFVPSTSELRARVVRRGVVVFQQALHDLATK